MFSETLAELAVKIQVETGNLDKGLDGIDKKLKKASVDYQKVGIGMMAVGAGITTAFVAAAKTAEDERVGIEKLSAVMRNAGVEYDNVKDSLESLILTQQMKTGIADDQQRSALQALIFASGDYEASVKNLTLAMDLAVAKDMDVVTAAELVGKVMAGEFGTLARYGIILGETATKADALAAIQAKVAGSAEAARSPIEVLKARLGDLGETVGSVLAPKLSALLDKYIIPIVDKLVIWIEKNPKLVETLLGIAAVVGVGGALLYGLSSVSKAILAINAALIVMQSLTGIGIVKVLAGLAVAGGAIFAMNQLMSQTQVPQYANGGEVPGPSGRPQLAMVHGGETVVPEGGAFGINATVNVLGSVITERELITTIREEFLKLKTRNTSTGF